LGAFSLLDVLWLMHGPNPANAVGVVTRDLAANHSGAFVLGLSIVLYNYGGWDNVSTFASEVDRRQRNYPLALGGGLVLAVLAYVIPVIAGITITVDPVVWATDAGWPVIANVIGGRGLGILLAMAGLVAQWTLFNAQLLYVSRIPFVMARDGWLPKALARADSDTAVPTTSIACFCLVSAVLASPSYGSLVIILCLLYTAALMLEFLALVILRVRRPDAHRPFRVPFGTLGLAYVCLAPLSIAGAVLTATLRDGDSYGPQLLGIVVIVLAGIALHLGRRKHAHALLAVTASDAAAAG
jgi:amino acid transporter